MMTDWFDMCECGKPTRGDGFCSDECEGRAHAALRRMVQARTPAEASAQADRRSEEAGPRAMVQNEGKEAPV